MAVSRLLPLRRDALLLARALGAGVRRPKAPFKVTAAVTWVCDQHCRHCNIWRRERGPELSAAEWRQVWRGTKGALSWIDLTGGEVSSREDFAEIAVAAVEELPALAMLHFPTNGADPQRLEQLARTILRADPHRLVVSISLDGPPRLHGRIRGDRAAFDGAVRSYQRLRALGVDAYFGMTLSPHNEGELDSTFAALRERLPELRWQDLHHNFFHRSSHYFENQDMDGLSPDRLQELAAGVLERRGLPANPTELLEWLYLRRVGGYAKSGASAEPCTSLSGNCFIAPDGTVHPCHIWERPLGRLSEVAYALPQLWNRTSTLQARERVREGRCPGCWTPCEAYPSLLAAGPGLLRSRSA
ncbi:MAG: hypothetical protein CMP23_09895 [Rickettsiales bacterium]|nr:hypothetical protein [Rickettsiales bacterium]|tara:strand:- start:882 stop:1955 length:1074 start_codon:yes stop_codon:yes gene_type:complete